jgi:uncharacterized protein with HEPN domain
MSPERSMQKADRLRVAELLDAAKLIRSYVHAADREAFQYDVMRRNAVTGRIIAMAGLTKRISDEFKDEHRDIPWHRISSFGDLMVRSPERAHPNEVWQYANSFVPELIGMIEAIFLHDD